MAPARPPSERPSLQHSFAPLGDDVRLSRDERVLSRDAGDFVVLLGPHADNPIVLRGTGIVLWAALDEPRSVAELAGRLAAQFAADPVGVRADIASLIGQLRGARILRVIS